MEWDGIFVLHDNTWQMLPICITATTAIKWCSDSSSSSCISYYHEAKSTFPGEYGHINLAIWKHNAVHHMLLTAPIYTPHCVYVGALTTLYETQ